MELFNPNQDKSTPGSGATPTAGGGGSRASVGPGSAASSTSGGARIGDGTPAAAMSLLTSSVAGGSATQKVTLLDDQLRFLEGAKGILSDQPTSALVVGVLGRQSDGKSTLLNLLADGPDGGPFKVATGKTLRSAGHQTDGIELAVTADRMLLLDTQPLLSPSLLCRLLAVDAPLPPGARTPEQAIDLQSYQLAMLTLTVCDVVLVPFTSVGDLALWRVLRSAIMLQDVLAKLAPQMLHGASGAVGSAPRRGGSTETAAGSAGDRAELVFVFNQAPGEYFTPEAREALVRVIQPFVGPQHRPRLVVLPQKGAADESFRGHPSFDEAAEELVQLIAAWPRRPFGKATGRPASEREWLAYTQKVWTASQHAAVAREYVAAVDAAHDAAAGS